MLWLGMLPSNIDSQDDFVFKIDVGVVIVLKNCIMMVKDVV